ncbi:unnamed protein product [Linum trigynum]|uniref:Uncharacterized protein n=1 Tax=Linum trigynum TaxID=586398 RepID=A0AAV2DMT2_9ROSI
MLRQEQGCRGLLATMAGSKSNDGDWRWRCLRRLRAACAGSGEQKPRWRLTMATSDGALLAAASCLRRRDGSAGGLVRWLTAAGWRRSPSVVCSTSRLKMEK